MIALSALAAAASPSFPPGEPARGEQIAGLAGCASCHTVDGGAPYAGGYAVETDFGTFYGSNLTPDPVHGLGAWTGEAFADALRRGRRPGGGHYWAAFPYPSFTALTDGDVADLWAFLRALPPAAVADVPHDTPRTGVERWAWHAFFFSPRPWTPRTDPVVDRGAYLVEAVGHCPECHTPRTKLGRLRRSEGLSGSDQIPHGGPDLRPDTLRWSDADWETFLEMGMLPDGDFVGSGMYPVIEHGTSKLSPADRAAMIRALQLGP
jgi:mono/diheme cytochrome c family protein